MKKGGTKKKQTKKAVKASKISRNWQFLILAVAILIAGVMIYQRIILPQQEKKKFAEAENIVKELTVRVNRRVENAEKLNFSNGCYQNQEKWGGGTKYCSISANTSGDMEKMNKVRQAIIDEVSLDRRLEKVDQNSYNLNQRYRIENSTGNCDVTTLEKEKIYVGFSCTVRLD